MAWKRPHAEEHLSFRSNWLRAGVLGANDGILSTASLVLGVWFLDHLMPLWDPRRQALEQAMTRMTPGGRNSWGNNNRVFEALINPTGGVSPLREALVAGVRTLARPDPAPSVEFGPDPPRDTTGFRPEEAIL